MRLVPSSPPLAAQCSASTTANSRDFTPEMTITHGVWHDSALKVDGLGLAGLNLAVVIAGKPDKTLT